MVRDPRCHRRRNTERLVDAAEVVERKPEHQGCAVILELLAERIGEPGEAPRAHSNREVLPFEGLRLATASQKFQIITDGFTPYRSAISNTLEDRVDLAQLIKVYRATPEGERRHSPAEVASVEENGWGEVIADAEVKLKELARRRIAIKAFQAKARKG
jgi:hypothetical protein